jgi:IS30 family transposase
MESAVIQGIKKITWDDNELEQLLRDGLTYGEIANKLDKPYSTVARYIITHPKLSNLYKYRK